MCLCLSLSFAACGDPKSSGSSGADGSTSGSTGATTRAGSSGGATGSESGAGGSTAGSDGNNATTTGAAGASSDTTGGAGGSNATSGAAGAGIVDEQALPEVATLLESCVSDDGFYRTQVTLRQTQADYAYPLQALDCLREVSDGCNGVLGCFGFLSEAMGPCGECSGVVANYCADEAPAIDCSANGYVCVEGECVADESQSCGPEFQDVCNDQGQPLNCDDRIQVGPTCPELGLECSEDTPTFDTDCVGTGQICEDSVSIGYLRGSACADGVLTACVQGGLAEIECSLLGEGFDCQEADDIVFCGLASECEPQSFEATCDGASLVFCNAGRLDSVDCAPLGFDDGCTTDPYTRCN